MARNYSYFQLEKILKNGVKGPVAHTVIRKLARELMDARYGEEKAKAEKDLQLISDSAEEGMTAFQISLLLGISETSVRSRAEKAGIDLNILKQRWTEEEDMKILHMLSVRALYKDIFAALPGRTWSAVRGRIQVIKDR